MSYAGPFDVSAMNECSLINRLIATFLLMLSLGLPADSQELRMRVTINHNQIERTDVTIFDNLQRTLEQFVNERQWTDLQFQPNERIVCSLNITVTSYNTTTNAFSCKALIQANRPV